MPRSQQRLSGSDPVTRFAQRLRDAREAAGLTLRQLATTAGYARSTLSAAESGARLPAWAVTESYVRACGLRDLSRWRGWWESARDHEPATDPTPAGPAQLPPDISSFTGRERELAGLDALADRVDGPMPIAVLAGTGGVGKTALAVHWAHRRRRAFPDGQLYVDLRGYDPERPLDAADALAGFLRALGVAGAEIPPGAAERTALFRSLTSGRRVLVLLDNAADVGQVRPLLPGAETCAVLVTSRDALALLVAVHGARRFEVDLLPGDDALRLMDRLIGSRVRAEPVAAAALVEQCTRLPLALRIAAEISTQRAQTSLTDIVGELAERQRRLTLLDAWDDTRGALTAVFSWSYRRLTPVAARTFRLAGLHPGPDVEAYAMGALTGEQADAAADTLALLARAHLMHETSSGRYGMHDLLRAYAISLVDEAERARAEAELAAYYTEAVRVATGQLEGAGPEVAAGTLPPLNGRSAASSWLDAERPTLQALIVANTDSLAGDLAARLFLYLDNGFLAEGVVIHRHAQRVARDRGDRDGEALASLHLGAAHGRMGGFTDALATFEHAYRLYDGLGDAPGRGRALSNIGAMQSRTGDVAAAVGSLEQALAESLRAGKTRAGGRTLINLAALEEQLGKHRSAAARLRQALELARDLGDRDSEAAALTTLGSVETRLGDGDDARRHHRTALDIFRSLGNQYGEAYTLNGLGEATPGPDALRHHEAALALATRVGAREEQERARAGLDRARPATSPAERHPPAP